MREANQDERLLGDGGVQLIAAQPYAAPGWDFAALLGGGVLAALAMTTLTLPLIDSATRHDAVRFE